MTEGIALAQIDKSWFRPQIPPELSAICGVDSALEDIAGRLEEEMAKIADVEERSRIELGVLDWLYILIRGNIKRGRAFELDDVLILREADCLGYTKLLNALGAKFGLAMGVADVVVDNAGRYVPHPINILNLSNRSWQLVDLWYGSKKINHRKVILQIKEQGEWKIKEATYHELKTSIEVRGLPLEYLDALTYYIWGNRHLERAIRSYVEEEYNQAIECYTSAIKLYPQNARFYFNRAIALENKGEPRYAQTDYAQALKDEASQIQVLAREYQEIIQLIELDRMHIEASDQEMYLLCKGYISGKEMPLDEVAREYGLPEGKVEQIVSDIEARLSGENSAVA